MNVFFNTVEFEGKGNLDSEAMKVFLNEEERLDFEANLQWVISQTPTTSQNGAWIPTISASGGSETRPKNIAVIYLIKY